MGLDLDSLFPPEPALPPTMTVDVEGQQVTFTVPTSKGGQPYAYGGWAVCHGRGCGQLVFWFKTPKGARSPHDADGISHFATCPDRARFRR